MSTYFESPQVTESVAPLPVAESAYPRAGFWRTIVVVMIHWIAQAVICIQAQGSSRQDLKLYGIIISASSIVHIILLSSFAGMVLRSRFLFSWSMGMAILSFGISLTLCYFLVGNMKDSWAMLEVLPYHACMIPTAAVCFVIWPIFRWSYELTSNITGEVSQLHKIKVQFSLRRLLYIALIVALGSYCLAHANMKFFERRPTNMYSLVLVPAIVAISPFINIYLIFRPRFSILQLIHANIWIWITIVLLYLWGSKVPTPPWGGMGPQWTGPNPWGVNREFIMYTKLFVGATAHLFVSAFLYRWAGWRLVRFAGHNRSVYKQIYRWMTDSR